MDLNGLGILTLRAHLIELGFVPNSAPVTRAASAYSRPRPHRNGCGRC